MQAQEKSEGGFCGLCQGRDDTSSCGKRKVCQKKSHHPVDLASTTTPASRMTFKILDSTKDSSKRERERERERETAVSICNTSVGVQHYDNIGLCF